MDDSDKALTEETTAERTLAREAFDALRDWEQLTPEFPDPEQSKTRAQLLGQLAVVEAVRMTWKEVQVLNKNVGQYIMDRRKSEAYQAALQDIEDADLDVNLYRTARRLLDSASLETGELQITQEVMGWVLDTDGDSHQATLDEQLGELKAAEILEWWYTDSHWVRAKFTRF